METGRAEVENEGVFHFPLLAHFLPLKLLVHTKQSIHHSIMFLGPPPIPWVFVFLSSHLPLKPEVLDLVTKPVLLLAFHWLAEEN